MSDQHLRDLFNQAADQVGPPPAALPTSAKLGLDARRRRGNARAVLATVAVVLAVIGGAIIIRQVGPSAHVSSYPLPRPSLPTPPTVDAGGLAQYQWSTLPQAPIAVRAPAASAWTGSEFIVWGGADRRGRFSDGAAYNPATRHWSVLPPSPLTQRSGATSVWDGRELIIWGGQSATQNLRDGAAYNPASRTWRALPPAPVPAWGTASMTWTGNRVLLATNDPSPTGAARTRSSVARALVHLAAYNPDTRAWVALAPIRSSASEVLYVTTAATRHDLFVFTAAQNPIPHGLQTLNEAFRYDAGSGTWKQSTILPVDRGRGVPRPLVVGSSLFFPSGGAAVCRLCAGLGPSNGNTASIAGLDTAKSVPAPHTSRSDWWSGSTEISTGSAIIGVASPPDTDPPISPIENYTEALNPSTREWAPLAPAPEGIGTASAHVWTGTQLLVWGTLVVHGTSRISTNTGLSFSPR